MKGLFPCINGSCINLMVGKEGGKAYLLSLILLANIMFRLCLYTSRPDIPEGMQSTLPPFHQSLLQGTCVHAWNDSVSPMLFLYFSNFSSYVFREESIL